MKFDKSNRAEEMNKIREQFKELSLSQRRLEQFRLIYNEGQHPLQVWEAINLCYHEGIPFPGWVNDALAVIAYQLLQIDTPGKKAPQLVFEAVGIEGREFSHKGLSEEDKQFCLEIEKLKREKKPFGSRERSITEARRLYAKRMKLKFDTVKKKHKAIKSNPFYEDMIAHYFDGGDKKSRSFIPP